jgi:hypothetical protein
MLSKKTKKQKNQICKMEMEEPDVNFLMFLTITISLFHDQIFNYKQLALNTKIGDPSKDW